MKHGWTEERVQNYIKVSILEIDRAEAGEHSRTLLLRRANLVLVSSSFYFYVNSHTS